MRREFARWMAAGCAALAWASGAATAQTNVMREGAGPRREALNAMELTPLDPQLWKLMAVSLSGDPVTQAAADGKVVVLYTWSSFLPASQAPIAALRRLAEAHPADLLIIGVHHPEGWDEAGAAAERRRVNFPVVHDREGAVRAALKVDEDPDFYVVDRAGQLRFADVDTSSLGTAVETLLAESADHAATTRERLAEADAARRDAERRSRLIRQQLALSDIPDVPFQMPGEEAFRGVDWPRFPRQSADGQGGDPAKPFRDLDPIKVDVPIEAGAWLPGPPRPLDGRVRLLHFFVPARESTSGDAAVLWDEMDAVQRAYQRDLVLVSVAVPEQDRNRGFNQDNSRTLARDRERLKRFLDRRPLNHPVLDMLESGALLTAVRTDDENTGSGETITPYFAIIGSDGNLRWRGDVFRFEDFRAALPKIIRLDPGVKARQEAEQAFIMKSSGVGGPAETAAPDEPADPAADQSAAWPAFNRGELYAADAQGKPLPAGLAGAAWLTPKPAGGTDGKVLVIDFWATWCGPCKAASPKLDALQRANADRLAVLAVGGQDDPRGTVESYVREHPVGYHHLYDASQTLYKALEVRAIPHVAIVSTDGVIRWQGNPHDPTFEDAVRRVLAADPGL